MSSIPTDLICLMCDYRKVCPLEKQLEAKIETLIDTDYECNGFECEKIIDQLTETMTSVLNGPSTAIVKRLLQLNFYKGKK